jgi:hypothetical protein
MIILSLGIICNILYTSWIQNGVWLSEGSFASCSIQNFEENKNAKNKK